MTNVEHQQMKFIYSSVLILILASIFNFFKGPITAFEWPALDLAPFLERYFDKSFAINDFITNATTVPNPRHIFAYFIIIPAKLLNVHWYSAFFFLKVILLSFIPALFYLAILGYIKNIIKDQFTFLLVNIFITSSILFVIFFPAFLSIAWWHTLLLQSTPQTFSLLSGLCGIVLLNYLAAKSKYFLTFICFFISVLSHPTVGTFLIIFNYICQANLYKEKWKEALMYSIISIVLPLIVLNLIFTSDVNLSAKEFAYHYTRISHSRHYTPSLFGNLYAYPWYYNSIFIIISFLGIFIFSAIKRYRDLAIISSISFLGYTGSILFQYLFVELYPIKIIATFGPVRFSPFAYYLLVLCWAFLIIHQQKFLKLLFYLLPSFCKSVLVRLWGVYLYSTQYVTKKGIVFITIFVVIIGICCRDNPFDIKNDSLLMWIKTSTPKTSVFATHKNHVYITLQGRRSIFTGNGFPFNEKYFREHTDRVIALDCPLDQQKNITSQCPDYSGKYYHSLMPQYFKQLQQKYKLDYVIFDKHMLDPAYKIYKPTFENEEFIVYNVYNF